jgi:hypothetical protein
MKKKSTNTTKCKQKARKYNEKKERKGDNPSLSWSSLYFWKEVESIASRVLR